MTAPTQPAQDIRLRDPLSEVTRKERLYLLGISTVGITIESTGLIPSEITTLGIKFGEADQDALLYILALVIAYFLAAFILYAASDFLSWRLALRDYIEERMRHRYEEQREVRNEELERYQSDLARRYFLIYRLRSPVSVLRAVFEFLLPVAVGIYAMYILVY